VSPPPVSPDTPFRLEFRAATVPAGAQYDEGFDAVSLALAPGGLALVRLTDDEHAAPWLDAAAGLVEPVAGEIRVEGRAWTACSPRQVAESRAGIGMIFARPRFIANLDVDENVLLAARYHALAPEAELRDRARALAQDFGLSELPSGRPHAVRRRDLGLASWVRAFLARPRLVLLDRPLLDAPSAALESLVTQVARAREGGAAVLWIAGSEREWAHPAVRPTLQFRGGAPILAGG
jgi:ABC-type uncharacterized transport system ATPase subunit